MYANLVTNDHDALYAKIFIGSAAGPYKQPLKDRRRDRGLHQRIMSHSQKSVKQRSLKKHERLLQSPGIRSNWLIIVSFQQNVPKFLVNLAHAVITVMFRASENPHYIACRPDRLPICPQSWGLNELSSLGHHGLAGYNKIRHGQSIEEAALVYERNVTAGQCRIHSGRQEYYNRLISGSPIHVNVLVTKGVFQRFFITPLTEADGCHVDVVIPRSVGLGYGLQVSRTVTVQFDLQLGKDHLRPYAVKAPSCSSSRKLGILISGEYSYGPQKDNKFEYWIQSNRHEAIRKAERLIWKIYGSVKDEGLLKTGTHPKCQQPTKLDDWLEDDNAGEFERTNIGPHNSGCSHIRPQTATHPAPGAGKENASWDPAVFAVCLQILHSLRRMVQKKGIRAMESIRTYMLTESMERLATKIAEAVRPGVVSLLKDEAQFELSRKVVLHD